MKKFTHLSILALLVIIVSCSTDNSDNINNQEKEVIINNSNLSSRLSKDNLGVIGIKEAPSEDPANSSVLAKIGVSSLSEITVDDVASNIPLVLVAEVSAPVYEGTTLRATHVAINGDYAYVSYNVEGDKYLGAVDVINISDPTNPVIEIEAILPNTDISSVYYYNNTLYIAGASNALDNGGANPAVLIKMELENGLPTDNVSKIDMTSYVATDVIANANGIYSVSGDNGDLAQYDLNSNTLVKSVQLNDLRALGEHNSKIIVLSGTEGISIYDNNLVKQGNSITTSQDIADSKRTIDFYNNNVMVSEGKQGLGIYNIDNGSKSATIDLPTVTDSNINQDEVVTNAVTIENDHIFMANGAAGLAVHDLTDGITNITKTGTLDIDGSTNYVKSANGYIFVASGNGGLKIIKTVSDTSNTGGSSIVCTGLEFTTYTGGSWLNINSNESKYYSGAASLKGLNTNANANLTFCGTLAVSESLNVNSDSHFKMSGSLVQGNFSNKWLSLNINDNATLELEGTLVVYGNMVFNTGANLKVLGDVTIHGDVTIDKNVTIEFLGSDSSITINGNVTTKNGVPTITGTYNDVLNKL